MNDFDSVDFNLSYGNFDPSDIQVDETINAVFVVDVSPSIASYAKDLNHAFNDFIQTMQQSHVADQLLVSVLEFHGQVSVKTGFQPVMQVPNLTFVPQGSGTALYDGVLQGLEQAISYRTNLEASGVVTKTLIFVITDGEDNMSANAAAAVKNRLAQIMKKEENAFSFTTILFGVGNAASFEQAQRDMGIQWLAKVGTSGQEIRKMIGFISQSISSTATNQSISF